VETVTLAFDPIPVFNLIVCIIIVVLGILCYLKSREKLPLYIGAAFGLFGVSHAATILGFAGILTLPLIVIRAAAYLLVIYALYVYLRSCRIAQETTQAWVEFFQEDTKPGTAPDAGEKEKE